MNTFDPKTLKEIGGVFKFGRGALGRSSIVVSILLIGVVVAIWRLRSDIAIIAAIVLGAALFFLWLYKVLKFSEKHPDVALLEGGEWTSWKRFEATARSLPHPQPEEQLPSADPEYPQLTVPEEEIQEPDK